MTEKGNIDFDKCSVGVYHVFGIRDTLTGHFEIKNKKRQKHRETCVIEEVQMGKLSIMEEAVGLMKKWK